MHKKDQHDYGMKMGHSPVAEQVVCVDFDATLFPWGPLMNKDAQPLPGAAEAVNAFADNGWRVVIFTSRMSPSWLTFAHEDEYTQRAYVAYMLNKYSIPFHEITAEKVPAQAYIDDKAIEFNGTNWPQIQERVLGYGNT